MADTPVLGFIGLGNIGRPMAERIAATGLPLRLWARRPQSLEGLIGDNVDSSASPRALGAACDVIGVCVRTDEELLDIVLREPDGVLGGMRPGSVLLAHSTVLPRTIEQLDEAARARGVMLLDAPVSGGPTGARDGTLTILLGGEAEAIERARPMLESVGGNLPHVGGVGAGQVLKLINNNLCYANVAMGLAALELVEKLGIDAKMAASVIRTSSGMSAGFGLIMDRAPVEKMSGPTSNIRKDVDHLIELVEERGIASATLTAVSTTTAARVKAYRAAGAPAAS
jgi:3-hydroxyisobutyrate dehydrogenase